MTLVRVARPQPRVFELESEHRFAGAMQQAERLRKGSPQTVKVIIQVSADDRTWEDWEETWSGPWRPVWEGGIPQPTKQDLRNAGESAGARYVRFVYRSVI